VSAQPVDYKKRGFFYFSILTVFTTHTHTHTHTHMAASRARKITQSKLPTLVIDEEPPLLSVIPLSIQGHHENQNPLPPWLTTAAAADHQKQPPEAERVAASAGQRSQFYLENPDDEFAPEEQFVPTAVTQANKYILSFNKPNPVDNEDQWSNPVYLAMFLRCSLYEQFKGKAPPAPDIVAYRRQSRNGHDFLLKCYWQHPVSWKRYGPFYHELQNLLAWYPKAVKKSGFPLAYKHNGFTSDEALTFLELSFFDRQKEHLEKDEEDESKEGETKEEAFDDETCAPEVPILMCCEILTKLQSTPTIKVSKKRKASSPPRKKEPLLKKSTGELNNKSQSRNEENSHILQTHSLKNSLLNKTF
jgi:hypothetical protein